MSCFKDISLKIEREKPENQKKSRKQIEEEDFLDNLRAEQNLEIDDYINR